MSIWFGIALLSLQASTPPAPGLPQSPWARVQFLVGEWEGESEGEPGKGRSTVVPFRAERPFPRQNVSTYPPQPKNEKGEVQALVALQPRPGRAVLVLRQFHQEGFVNQYAVQPGTGGSPVVFESEALENIPAGWRARETYEVVSADEFTETFELAQGDGNWSVYSRTRFKRKGRSPGARP
jgi:hypothetical protein